MIVVLKINSRSRLNVLHHVIVDTEKKSVSCDCEAYKFIGRCGHIKFYKVLIWRLMHETPR